MARSCSIPYEMLIKIFSYFDPITLMSVGRVSKRFYEVANDKVKTDGSGGEGSEVQREFVHRLDNLERQLSLVLPRKAAYKRKHLEPVAEEEDMFASFGEEEDEDYLDEQPSEGELRVLWYKIYTQATKKRQWKGNSLNLLEKKLDNSTISEKECGFWKKKYISDLFAGGMSKINQIMKASKPYTACGVPANMEKSVKMSGLKWMLTFKDAVGKETVINQSDIIFRDTSVTVVWNNYTWPAFNSLTILQLHGVTPVQLDNRFYPSKTGLRRRSLIAEYNLKDFQECKRYVGEDSLIKLFCLKPCLIIGLWKRNPEIAFVMAGLHYHQLLEKSFWGTAISSYIFPPHVPVLDDIDPEYGLHGYQLHIDMYSGQKTYLCRTFRGLFCRKEFIRKGFLRMTAIGIKNNREHMPLVGNVNFLWQTLAFKGCIKKCLMMDVTVLDESETPYWCFSAPVQLRECEYSETLYDFLGQSFLLEYRDSVGKIYAQLNWLKETEEHFINNLVLYLNTEKVNSHFGTNYSDAPN
ncbi:F-box only protein 15 [Gastrophryne carolinensis]